MKPFHAICVDPGKKLIGFAVVKNGELIDANVYRFEDWFDVRRFVAGLRNRFFSMQDQVKIVSEVPQIYQQRRQDKDQNDLIDVAAVAGAVVAAGMDAVLVRPHTWKGSIAKEKHQVRLLSDVKKAAPDVALGIESIGKTVRHNALDAAGLALWACEKARLW